ncbi:unnamed protein product, partial [Bubo scandiacus]
MQCERRAARESEPLLTLGSPGARRGRAAARLGPSSCPHPLPRPAAAERLRALGAPG